MASADDRIKAVLAEFEEGFNTESVWRVQGTAVISHKVLERVAAKAGIRFEPPVVLRAERDEAVMLVTGFRDDRSEWSVGEALVNVNYLVSGKQAAYVYAMAEKRAKDRVILKLVQLHGLAYSEEEADEFKHGAPRGKPAADDFPGDEPNDNDPGQAAADFIRTCEVRITKAADRPTLLTWWNSDGRRSACRDFDLTDDQIRSLHQKVKDRAEALQSRSAA